MESIEFHNFMQESYKFQVIDDFHHLQKYHDNELEAIYQTAKIKRQLIDCNIDTCSYSNRHYRVKSDNNKSSDNNWNFYKNTMDSLHFYIYHLHHVALRESIKQSDDIKRDNEDSKSGNNDPYFDSQFSRKYRAISQRRNTSARFRRVNGNKFNISIANDSTPSDDGNDQQLEDNDTFMDHLYSYLHQQMEQHKIYDDNNDNAEDPDIAEVVDDDNEFADENDDLFEDDGDDDWGSDNDDQEQEEKPFVYEYNHDDIQQLIQYFIIHEYDTETVDIDVSMFIDSGGANLSSNIWSSDIPNKVMMDEVIQVFKESKSMTMIV